EGRRQLPPAHDPGERVAPRHGARVRDLRDLGLRRREGHRGRGGGREAAVDLELASPYSARVPEPLVHRGAIKAPVASKMVVVVVVVSVLPSSPSSMATSAV